MSQERTEQPKSAPEAVRRIMDAQGEIDRLNAENESLRQTLARYFGDAKTVQEYERAEDELRSELDAATAEIGRLNTKCSNLEGHNEQINKQAEQIKCLEAEKAHLIHEAWAAFKCTSKEVEENAELREEIERLKNALDKPRQNLLFELHNERTKKEEALRERDWNRKEIERLRAVGERIMIDAVKMSYEYGDAWRAYESLANNWRVSLKGAE